MPRVPAAERRDDLVTAAVRVIASHGVDGATTRRIAEEAKAPLATLHYCFSSKELLFQAVLERLAAEYRDVLVRGDVHGDVASTARALVRALMEWYLESPDFGAASIELISWAQRQDGEPAVIMYNESFEVMRTILQEAATGRNIDAETIDELTYVLASLSDGFGINYLTFADRAAAIKQMDVIVDVLDAWMATKLESTPARMRPRTEAAFAQSVMTSCPG